MSGTERNDLGSHDRVRRELLAYRAAAEDAVDAYADRIAALLPREPAPGPLVEWAPSALVEWARELERRWWRFGDAVRADTPGVLPIDVTVEDLCSLRRALAAEPAAPPIGLPMPDVQVAVGPEAVDEVLAAEPAAERERREDWTVGPDGRSNSSEAFEALVTHVARLVANIRVGENPESAALLIVAQLAHKHGLSPAAEQGPVPGAVVRRYQRCALALLALFPGDPLPADEPVHFLVERLEALVARKLLVPAGQGPRPDAVHELCEAAEQCLRTWEWPQFDRLRAALDAVRGRARRS